MQALFTLLIIALFATETFAQNWQRTAGPVGGAVRSMLMDSNGDLYASMAQSGENYKSTDNGETWQKLQGRFSTGATALSEGADGNLYATIPCGFFGPCAEGTGLFMSTDKGATWEKLSEDGFGANAMHVGEDGSIVVGLSQGFFTHGMMRSSDGGRSWSPLMPTTGRVQSFAKTDSAIYAAATSNGLLKSTNGGQDWEEVTVPCNDYCEVNGQYISNVVVSADGTLFVADAGDGIYITSDEGQSWERVAEGFATDETGVIAVWGLFASEDGNVYSWLFNTLMYRYAGDGSWIRLGDEIANSPISYASAAGPSGEVWVGAGENGVYYIDSDTDNWTPRSKGIVNGSARLLLATSDGTLFAGSQAFSTSDDQGETWTTVSAPRVSGIAVNSKDEFIVLDDSLFVSRDKARTWENLGASPWSGVPGFVRQIEFNSSGDALVVYQNFTSEMSDLYKVNADLTEWELLNFEAPNIAAVEFADDGSIYFASGEFGAMTVYTSKDGGATFDFTSGRTFDEVIDLEKFGETLYMGATGLGVLRSTDDGLVWEERNDGLIAGSPFAPGPIVIRIVQASNGNLIASNFGQGLMISSNEGESWTNFNEGLTEDGITDASSIVEIDNVFFVGSNGQGVYRSEPLSTAISYVEPQRGTFRVTQNFPNPFTDETSIPVTLDEMSEVNITIFDQTGRLVSQVFQGDLGAGRHLFTVDAHHNNMTPGSYYCTFKTNDQTATMKMVVVR